MTLKSEPNMIIVNGIPMNQQSQKDKLLDEDTYMVLYYFSETTILQELFGVEAWKNCRDYIV